MHNGKIHQYNLTIEQQFKEIGFRISYVGSHDYGMNYGISINKPAPSLIRFTTDRRPYPQSTSASYYRNNGEAKFNVITFEVMRRAGQITFDAHWTLAPSYSNFQSGSNFESPSAPLFFARDQYTPRQRAVVNAVWEIPVGKGRRYLSNGKPVMNSIPGDGSCTGSGTWRLDTSSRRPIPVRIGPIRIPLVAWRINMRRQSAIGPASHRSLF